MNSPGRVASSRATAPATTSTGTRRQRGAPPFLATKWTVPAGRSTIPLVLEKEGYRPVELEVPVMQERCYAVRLARMDSGLESAVADVANAECQCAMFTGTNTWPEK